VVDAVRQLPAITKFVDEEDDHAQALTEEHAPRLEEAVPEEHLLPVVANR